MLQAKGSPVNGTSATLSLLTTRHSERQTSSPETLDEPKNHHQQHRTERGNENGAEQALAEWNGSVRQVAHI